MAEDEVRTGDFAGPEEYLENPDIARAVEESDTPVHLGADPPRLAGEYSVDGTVVDTHSDMSQLQGMPLQSTFCFFNQTTSNRIEFRETFEGGTVGGSGGFITGEDGYFTSWQESDQEGAEAGLPSGCSIHVAAVISGQKLDGGDLDAEGLSIITATSGCPESDIRIEGLWWKWVAYFELDGEC